MRRAGISAWGPVAAAAVLCAGLVPGPPVEASNMAFRVRQTYSAYSGSENFYIVSLPGFTRLQDADDLLRHLWRGLELSLERHDPWTDQTLRRTATPDPATGEPVLSGDDFPLESNWGYVLRLSEGYAGLDIYGSHDPGADRMDLPFDPLRTNIRHVGIPRHTIWEDVDDLLLDTFYANGSISLTAIHYDNAAASWLTRSVAPDASGLPVLSGTTFGIREGEGVTLRLDADPGPGGAVYVTPHF